MFSSAVRIAVVALFSFAYMTGVPTVKSSRRVEVTTTEPTAALVMTTSKKEHLAKFARLARN